MIFSTYELFKLNFTLKKVFLLVSIGEKSEFL